MNNPEKNNSKISDKDLFEIYYKTKSIEFITDIKEYLNNNGFKILDNTDNNFTEAFYKLLEENLICQEEDKSKELLPESDDDEFYDELYQ